MSSALTSAAISATRTTATPDSTMLRASTFTATSKSARTEDLPSLGRSAGGRSRATPAERCSLVLPGPLALSNHPGQREQLVGHALELQP